MLFKNGAPPGLKPWVSFLAEYLSGWVWPRKYKVKPAVEQRKYLRLDTVFPVQFRLEDLEGETFLSSWLQGFTNNVSRGGLCLFINNIGQAE